MTMARVRRASPAGRARTAASMIGMEAERLAGDPGRAGPEANCFASLCAVNAGRREHFREDADEPDHSSVRLSEEYAPAALRAVPEDLRQIGISCLLGGRQPRLETLFPRLKLDKARTQRRIIGGCVVF